MDSHSVLYQPVAIHPIPNMLRDGYLAKTYGLYVVSVFDSLLKVHPSLLHITYSVDGWPQSFTILQADFRHVRASVESNGGQHLILLDYAVDVARGSVVPQNLWLPHSARDMRQYVTEAKLLPPHFSRSKHRGRRPVLSGCYRRKLRLPHW